MGKNSKSRKGKKATEAAVAEPEVETEAAEAAEAEVDEVEVVEADATSAVEATVEATVEADATSADEKPAPRKRGRKGKIDFEIGARLVSANYEGFNGFATVVEHPVEEGRKAIQFNGSVRDSQGEVVDSLTKASNELAALVQAELGSTKRPGTSGTRIWAVEGTERSGVFPGNEGIAWRDDVAFTANPIGKPRRGRKARVVDATDTAADSTEE